MSALFSFVVLLTGLVCLLPLIYAQENENRNRFFTQSNWPPKTYNRPPGFSNYGKLENYQNGPGGFDRDDSYPRPPQFSGGNGNQGNFGWNSPQSGVFFPDQFGENSENSEESRPPTNDYDSCFRKCRITQEFNPVCGSDGNNYQNKGELRCAVNCGRRVSVSYHGNCRTRPNTTAKTPTGMLISPGRAGDVSEDSGSDEKKEN